MKHHRAWTVGAWVVAAGGLLAGARAEPPIALPRPGVVERLPDTAPAGAIQGIILESERPQPYLGLVLVASNGSEVAATRTGPRGTFLFQNVPPGSYTVVCRKEESSGPAIGRSRVTVQPGRAQDVSVRLLHATPVP